MSLIFLAFGFPKIGSLYSFANFNALLLFPNSKIDYYCGKDYYKILGVNKNASESDIRKAYRKLALNVIINNLFRRKFVINNNAFIYINNLLYCF